jgi:hypothetical protein
MILCSNPGTIKKLKVELPHHPGYTHNPWAYIKRSTNQHTRDTSAHTCLANHTLKARFSICIGVQQQMNGNRKCSMYTKWSIIQPLRRIKLCCLQENRWNWRFSVEPNTKKAKYYIFYSYW